MTRALALFAALVLAACAGPNHVTRGGMEQIARDWVDQPPDEQILRREP